MPVYHVMFNLTRARTILHFVKTGGIIIDYNKLSVESEINVDNIYVSVSTSAQYNANQGLQTCQLVFQYLLLN